MTLSFTHLDLGENDSCVCVSDAVSSPAFILYKTSVEALSSQNCFPLSSMFASRAKKSAAIYLVFEEVNSNAVLWSPWRLGDGEANNVVPSSFCRMCVFVSGCVEAV